MAGRVIEVKDIAKTLDEKKTRLQRLVKARSKASCSKIVSSETDVHRETEIEELEEQVRQMEKQLKETQQN